MNRQEMIEHLENNGYLQTDYVRKDLLSLLKNEDVKNSIDICSKCGKELIEEEEIFYGIHDSCEFPESNAHSNYCKDINGEDNFDCRCFKKSNSQIPNHGNIMRKVNEEVEVGNLCDKPVNTTNSGNGGIASSLPFLTSTEIIIKISQNKLIGNELWLSKDNFEKAFNDLREEILNKDYEYDLQDYKY